MGTSYCARKHEVVTCCCVVTLFCNDGSPLSRVIQTTRKQAFLGSGQLPCILLDDGDDEKSCCCCRFVVGGSMAADHASGAVGRQIG